MNWKATEDHLEHLPPAQRECSCVMTRCWQTAKRLHCLLDDRVHADKFARAD
jgi:hypothetical protein